ncbi:MAG: NAD(P)/FAD-dependent oxidoreductase [Gemmatimonadota bacterium]
MRRAVCDVLVVGGGPAGSVSAALFARAGFEVRLLERTPFPRFKACGDFLSPEGTRILADLGVEEAVRAAGARRLRGLLVSAAGEPPLRADFEGRERGFGYALERRRLDAILLDAARTAGADVLEGWSVAGLGGRGELRVAAPEGTPGRMRGRLIVGAGGKRCPVARDLRLQRRPTGDGRLDLLCHWDAPEAGDAYCEMHVAAPGYTGVAASGPGTLNVNTVVPRSWMRAWARRPNGEGSGRARGDPYRELVLGVAGVRRALRSGRPLYAPVASDVTPLSTARASADGVLLAGDAALFIDPFTGQGLYLAMRSAELAFEAGAAALAVCDTGASRLATYDARREREFAPKVALSRLLQAILYRPLLARGVASALRRDRRGASRLIGVIGDYRPAADLLRPAFLTRLAAAGLS